MPLELKTQLDLQAAVARAARRRADDELHREFSKQEIDARTATVLQARATTLDPGFRAGSPLASAQARNFIKDSKYLVGAVAEQSQTLEDEIVRSAQAGFAVLDDVRRQAGELDSALREEQVRLLEGFGKVHFNRFTRAQDLGLDWMDRDWSVDFGSFQSFVANEIILGRLQSVLTLPLKEERVVPIRKISFIAEETDRGDNGAPVLETSPQNLLIEDKVFRYLIFRQQFDDTSRLYSREPAQVTLELTLASPQAANTLRLSPLGHSRINVSELSYYDESGTAVALTVLQGEERGDVVLQFAPVRTRGFKLKLTQDAPVTSSAFTLGDMRIRELNELLDGAGFTQKFTVTEETVRGRLFDLSLEGVALGLREYNHRGLFRSLPLEVTSPAGAQLDVSTSHTALPGIAEAFGESTGVTPQTWVERYLGVRLTNVDNGVVVDDLIPVPDHYPQQSEALPLIGLDSRVKLFPDFVTDLTKIQVDSATFSSGVWSITTSAAHGLASGTTDLVLMGPAGSGFTGRAASFTVTSTTGLDVTLATTPSATTAITTDTLPLAYVYQPSAQAAVLEVYENLTLLTIGTHYQVSVDGGQTYYDFLPAHLVYPEAPVQVAGRFWIRILNPNVGNRYSCNYRVAAKQSLTSNRQVALRNGRVVFDRGLGETTGTIHTVLVVRGSAFNPYITPVLSNYVLKLREV